MIVAPVGASAVLIFAIPASPLSQPWPVFGGNVISAIVGVVVARIVVEPLLAAALAVSLGLVAMSFTRSLHPPGGAVALMAVIGGPPITSLGFEFPFIPVALNAGILVLVAMIFHKLCRRQYPHFPALDSMNPNATFGGPVQQRAGIHDEDLSIVLSRLNETLDIDRGDLSRLLREVWQQVATRSYGSLLCSDIMSKDIVSVREDASTAEAFDLLLQHDLILLPVTDHIGQLVGTVGWRELALAGRFINGSILTAKSALAEDKAMDLVAALTKGQFQAVIVVDSSEKVIGLITQADMLAAIADPAVRNNHVL